jgi:putative hemolysin
MLTLVLELGVIALLIAVNGIFSMSEIAVLTSKRHQLEQDARKGSARAGMVLELASRPERFMSAVQVGITLIGILTGVFSGATISELLAVRIAAASGLTADVSEGLAVALTVTGITYLTLIFGELLPKRIALSSPTAAAKAIAPVIRLVQAVAGPVVAVVSHNVLFLSRKLGIGDEGNPFTDDDVRSVIDEARLRGVIEAQEKDMLHRVMRFADLRVSAVMTHRSRIAQLDLADGLERNLEAMRAANHSNYPVVDGSPDNLVGFVSVKDLMGLRPDGQGLRSVLQEPIFVQESFSAMSLLRSFRETANKIAIVVDEYGDIQGLVTPTDILESLVGEIRDDPLDHPEILERADGTYLVDAHAPLYDVFERLGLDVHEDQSVQSFNTVSGFVTHHLDGVPAESKAFDYKGFRFEIVDMDGQRIDKIFASKAGRDREGDAAEGGWSI